jgi:hypothetical protein
MTLQVGAFQGIVQIAQIRRKKLDEPGLQSWDAPGIKRETRFYQSHHRRY